MDIVTVASQNLSTSEPRHLQRLNAAQVQIFRDRLNDRRINISKLVQDIGISRAMFYYIIKGQMRTTPDKLTRIAACLNIDPKIISD